MKRTWGKSRKLFALLLAVSATLLVTSYYRQGAARPVSFATRAAKSLAWGAAAAVDTAVSPARRVAQDVAGFWALRSQNENLRRQLTELKGRLRAATGLEEENRQLRQAANFLPRVPMSVVGAMLIQRSAEPWQAVILIDRGRKDGVRAGAPVLAANGGVLGQVIKAGNNVSEVRLLNDQYSGVGVEVKRNGLIGVVTGSAAGVVKLRYQAADADVRNGDRLITSGAGSRFPRGLEVGKVIAVQTGLYGLEKEILVKPKAELGKATVMFVAVERDSENR